MFGDPGTKLGFQQDSQIIHHLVQSVENFNILRRDDETASIV